MTKVRQTLKSMVTSQSLRSVFPKKIIFSLGEVVMIRLKITVVTIHYLNLKDRTMGMIQMEVMKN